MHTFASHTKNHLPVIVTQWYFSLAAAKSAAGFRSPLTTNAHDRASGFFVCEAWPHLRIMVGRAGEPKGSPGSLVTGTANPVRLTTLEFRSSSGELSKLTNEVATLWLQSTSSLTQTKANRSALSCIINLIALTPSHNSPQPTCYANRSAVHYPHCICRISSAISQAICTQSAKSLESAVCLSQTTASHTLNKPFCPQPAALRSGWLRSPLFRGYL